MRVPLKVRPATQDDATAVGEVNAESWRVGYARRFPADGLAEAVERRRHMWSDIMAKADFSSTTLLVAEADQEVVGFLHLGPAHDPHGAGEVYAFFVHPEAWGSEAATLMMNEALALLAQQFETAVLWTHGQGRAERFYAKTGWIPTGRKREENFGHGLSGPVVEYEHRLG